jgi:hypothetical protein
MGGRYVTTGAFKILAYNKKISVLIVPAATPSKKKEQKNITQTVAFLFDKKMDQ